MRDSKQYTMFSSTAKINLAFTAATTDIITATAHGWLVGDKLQFTTATTLPAGLSLATNYYVIEVLSVNTIKVSATPGGASVDITDTGTGTHTAHLKSKVIYVKDFQHVQLGLYTANSANLTIKFQVSDQEDVDFEAAQSATNRWDYVDVDDLEDKASIDGDTGVASAGTDDNRHFNVNIFGKTWFCADITSWTAGTLTLTATTYDNQ